MTTVSVLDVSKYIILACNNNNTEITNLKLQKLLYFVQGWYMVNFPTPLFNEDFEAWINGPVCKEVYKKYQPNGFNSLLEATYKSKMNTDQSGLIDAVLDVYGKLGPWQLVSLTHQEKPRIKARGSCSVTDYSSTIISKSEIKKSFMQKSKK